MPKYNCPRSYDQAATMLETARMNLASAAGDVQAAGYALRAGRAGDKPPIAIVDAWGRELVTFFSDQRIKVCTRGRNDHTTAAQVNACLPEPYRVRKRGCHFALCDSRRKRPLAIFLSSAFFTPESAEPASGGESEQAA